MARQTRKTKPLIYVFCEGESEQAYGDRTLDALMADGMPVREDTDERSGWLCQSHKTFTTVQEAIQFLEAH